MPYYPRRRRFNYRRRPRGTRYGASGLATRPRMFTRFTKMRRWNNLSSKVFYLKESGQLVSDLAGGIDAVFSVRDLPQIQLQQFLSCAQLFDQFKILAMTVRFFPANVGIEPHDAALSPTDFTLLRGNAVVWSDQRPGDNVPLPATINEVINYGSARLIQTRKAYKRTIFRPKGYPAWGGIDPQFTQDSWRGTITMMARDTTPAPTVGTAPVLWYWVRTWKVLFRGRKQT